VNSPAEAPIKPSVFAIKAPALPRVSLSPDVIAWKFPPHLQLIIHYSISLLLKNSPFRAIFLCHPKM